MNPSLAVQCESGARGVAASSQAGATTKRAPLLVCLGVGMFPQMVLAHDQWFHDNNLPDAPRGLLAGFANEPFLAVIVAAVVGVYVAMVLDSWLAARDEVVSGASEAMHDWIADRFYPFVRTLAAFHFSVVGLQGGMLLGPELNTSLEWVPLLQMLIGVCALFPFTGIAAGIGILALYGMGVEEFGVLRMGDYLPFVGAAIYLAWMSLDRHANDKSIAVLRVVTALTLVIGGLEKFSHPLWAADLLAHGPMSTFAAVNYDLYMSGAGVVEFCLAFLVLTGRFSGRTGSAILLALMAAAIGLFGWVDTVGHAVFVAALFGLILNRNNLIAEVASFGGKSGIWKTGALHSALFATLLLAFVQGYSLAGSGHLMEAGNAHVRQS